MRKDAIASTRREGESLALPLLGASASSHVMTRIESVEDLPALVPNRACDLPDTGFMIDEQSILDGAPISRRSGRGCGELSSMK
jgi:hypothetical protein